ncbi:chitin disaccharide deacetylase [Robertmurraya massiliosenegalensis]|uniref:chitin disaccharide deacetylase n=1 Tax=Robertmurraya TaxID=2837507 RepID=UPI0039A5895D
MKVIFNADDFGLTTGINDGVIESHINGLVDSATLMMNGLAVEHAVLAAKKTPSLKVGIHLVLTWGKPLSKDVPDLINEEEFFKYRNTYAQSETPNVEQVELEWKTQIEAFLKTGLELHHIDSHHHIHGWEPLKDVVLKLANEYQVPVRKVDSLSAHKEILLSNELYLDFYGSGVSEDIFEKLKEFESDSVEVMCHPAYVDDDLRTVSSYCELRERELELLCSIKRPDWAKTF